MGPVAKEITHEGALRTVKKMPGGVNTNKTVNTSEVGVKGTFVQFVLALDMTSHDFLFIPAPRVGSCKRGAQICAEIGEECCSIPTGGKVSVGRIQE